MATPFTDIFTKANALFEDAKLLKSLTDEEYTELLTLFLSKATSVYFKSCLKDLTDISEDGDEFNETLDDEEQWIIAEGIKLIWLEKQLYKEEKLRNRIGNKDYQTYSPANLIDKLTVLINDAKQNLNSLIRSYELNDFEGYN